MANYNKKSDDTHIRVGEVRFSYPHIFTRRIDQETGKESNYGAQLLIPKADTVAVKMIQDAIEAAKMQGKDSCWDGKIPPVSTLKMPMRDGDEEHPDDKEYEGMYFINANSPRQPGVLIRNEDGSAFQPMTDEEKDQFYPGCWGAAGISFYPFKGKSKGVACGLNNVIKTRDDERLGGGAVSADTEFADMISGSWLD